MTRASVVVPTHRRPEHLSRCLTALLDQHLDPDSFEIIVVDNAPGPESRCVVAEHTRRATSPTVRYMEAPQAGGPAAVRNLGWRAARGSIIAFTDDDCVPDPGWLSAGLSVFAEGVAGASGKLVVPVRRNPTDYERNAAWLAHSQFVTANCFYRKDALETAGGFDERFTMAWREDTDLYFRLLEAGSCLVHAPEALVIHPIRAAPWGVSLRQQRKSMFNALLFKKHPALYRERVQRSPPWRYYATIGLLVLALGSRVTGRTRLAWLATSVWAVVTGHFCLQRLRHTSRRPGHVAEMLATSILIPPLSIFWRLRGAIKFRVLFL